MVTKQKDHVTVRPGNLAKLILDDFRGSFQQVPVWTDIGTEYTRV